MYRLVVVMKNLVACEQLFISSDQRSLPPSRLLSAFVYPFARDLSRYLANGGFARWLRIMKIPKQHYDALVV